MKRQLAEDMVHFIAPIRQKTNEIINDENHLKSVLVIGAQKARSSAAATIAIVREAMGLNYY